ncbi:MAG: hypothetical protein NW226_17630 [Microscillaceae bacterium]|nr:hypothetical protein [Microscillaceae bacterium]
MNKANKSQIIRFNTLASKLAMDKDTKAGLVELYGSKGERSVKNLSERQIHELNQYLQSQVNKLNQDLNQELNKMRLKFYGLMHTLGYEIADTEGKLDYPKIEDWRKKYGVHGKKYAKLNDYPKKELAELLTQVEKMRDKKIQANRQSMKVNKEGGEG